MYISKTTLALVATFLSTTNAAVMNFYSDRNCQTPAGSRNVFDNTCAPTGGFQSYMITSGGGSGQIITTYSPNSCSLVQTSCNDAGSVGICYPAFDSDGGSNAVGSGPGCGVI